MIVSPVIVSPTTVPDNEYNFQRQGAHRLGLIPSATVKSTDVYTYRKECDAVADMNQGFDTLYVYTDVVDSRVVGDSLVSLLRIVPIYGLHDLEKFRSRPIPTLIAQRIRCDPDRYKGPYWTTRAIRTR